jgi:DNA mismatch repair protein MutS
MDVLEDGERVVFLRKVVPGNADKSYGIHVARLAGIPKAVSRRAEEILAELESSEAGVLNRAGRRDAMRQPMPSAAPQMQLTFFDAPSPVVAHLRELDVESLTPLDAIRVLFELKREAGS